MDPENFSPDCTFLVLSFLTYKELAKAERVCKKWRRIAERNWERLAQIEFPHFTKPDSSTWRDFYSKNKGNYKPLRIFYRDGVIFSAFSNIVAQFGTYFPGSQHEPFLAQPTLTDHAAPISSFFFYQRVNSCRIFTGSFDKTIKVWEKKIGSSTFTLASTLEGHTSTITEITGDATYLFSGSEKGWVRVWSRQRNHGYKLVQILKAHACQVTALQVDKKYRSQLLFCGAENGDIQMWARQEHRYGLLNVIRSGHKATITALKVQDRDALLFSSSNEPHIKIWKYRQDQIICLRVLTLTSAVSCIHIGSSPSFFYSSSIDGNITKWNLNLKSDPELPEWRPILSAKIPNGQPIHWITSNHFPLDQDPHEIFALTDKHIVRLDSTLNAMSQTSLR